MPRRVQLVVDKDPTEDMLELARAVKAALAGRYVVHVRTSDEDDEYQDGDRTPVDFHAREAPLIIRIGEGEPTLS